jgi:hypothetical protein
VKFVINKHVNGLGYDTKIEHEIMKISHDTKIIDRGSEACDL